MIDDGLNTYFQYGDKKKICALLVCNFLGGQPCIRLMEMEDYIKMDYRKTSVDDLN
jgi:hypothetical protein